VSHFFPNLKHLCFASAMLDEGGTCDALDALSFASFSIAFMNLRKCLMYSG